MYLKDWKVLEEREQRGTMGEGHVARRRTVAREMGGEEEVP